jgi:hypothetical protein
VSLPAAATIGVIAFYGCNALTTVDLTTAATIGGGAFNDCTALTTLYLPAATTIGPNVFNDCTSLTTVNLPAATSIDEHTFEDCTALTTISLPGTLTFIGSNPFAGCTGLTSITVAAGSPYSHSADGRMLLSNNGKKLIGYPSASGEVTLNGVETVGISAFWGCTGLTKVNLPDATAIDGSAFAECTALTTVDLPAAASIGGQAFAFCSSLATVTLGSSTAPSLGTEMFIVIDALQTVTVMVPLDAADWNTIVSGSPYTGADTANNWGNAFRGIGWDGTNYLNGTVNSNITLTIETYTP